MDRKTSARIAGLDSWHKSRPQKLADVAKGGLATLEKYGKGHYVRMAEASRVARQRRRESAK